MSSVPALVSAVITTWNGERYLRETIDSALAQDYPALEVVVADDGSTDATEAICRSYSERIRYFRQPKDDKFGTTAYVLALGEARGKYVAILDHDDRWLPGKIARQVEAMEAEPDAAACFTRFRIIDDAGADQGVSALTGASGMIYHLLLEGNRYCHASAMYRLDVFKAVGGINVDLGCGDWDLWLRMAHGHPFIMLDEVLTEYRVHARSYSANQTRIISAAEQVHEGQRALLHPDCPDCRRSFARGREMLATTWLGFARESLANGRRREAASAFRRAWALAPRGTLYWSRMRSGDLVRAFVHGLGAR